ncbi:MAG: ABC transporter permease [Bdellovibrionales bacterium]|jgi:putative ABC transport system permease protein|nr:ABC transporter permease [Bdellovibrionales bacterium]
MIFKLSFRNIFRNKRRTLLTMGMMTFGFVLFSFFIGIGDGHYKRVIEQFIRERTGHLQIHSKGYLETPKFFNSINNYQKLIDSLLNKEEILFATPRIRSGGLAFFEKQSMGVQIIGVDPEKEAEVTTLKRRVKEGIYFKSEHGAIIGQGVVDTLKVKLDDELIIISQGADGSIANEIFKIEGIITSKEKGPDDQKVYLSISKAQEFFAMEGRIHELALVLNSGSNLYSKATNLESLLSNDFKKIQISPWQVVEKDFYKAMLADKKGDMVAQIIIMIIIALGVLNTVLMNTLERSREFGVLKALGTTPTYLTKLILTETIIMALISIVIGSIIGTSINTYFSISGITLPSPVEYGGMRFETMRSMITFRTFYQPGLLIFVSSTLVSLYPGIKAARTNPVDAIRSV